jgi:hypothetical protein
LYLCNAYKFCQNSPAILLLIHMPAKITDPESFIDMYGLEAKVVLGEGQEMTLGQALEFEEMFCTADTGIRRDPAKRIGYLARKLAAGGSLRPEHEHLLGEGE